ncbi:unnamed protein product [Durusdinium trenchii]|uniref:Glutamine synthetase n=1 Tax=Durusdinium trenchii TaxID=1381693 RepID=A0ABP0SH19_9DINO
MQCFTKAGFCQGEKLAANADLSAVAKARGIDFFLVAFVDLRGVLRTKMVPSSAIKQIQRDGAGFAPAATWLDFGPHAADLLVMPDASTLLQVPFSPELAVVMGDCFIEGKEVAQSPRAVLKAQIAEAQKRGYVLKSGVEAEFFILSAQNDSISDERDIQSKPCYDAQSMMRRYALLADIVKTLNACDFGVYQTDHEDANGQFEINWHYRDCLTTADQHVFFKWAVKTLAERHGFRATFMPRPFSNLSGNGCHIHCSLWSGEKNVFEGKESISDLALQFLGGVLAKAPSFCAVTNPTVNSYKRLNGAATASGYTWSPNRVSWSGNNRSHMVRVPDNDRFELRLADGAVLELLGVHMVHEKQTATHYSRVYSKISTFYGWQVNPYLLPALMMACGFWGIDTKADPAKCSFPADVNMYEIPDGSPKLEGIASLPRNLIDATRALESDKDLSALLGADFMRAFIKLQKLEWADFSAHLSTWELMQTLDC